MVRFQKMLHSQMFLSTEIDFMRRCFFLFVFLLSLVSDVFSSETRHPNFVIVLVDDLGWADLGCYGSRFHETPRLDRMAREGMRFTDAYAACAVCSPTRAALQTGLYPARIGITDWIRTKYQEDRVRQYGGVMPKNGKNPTEYVGLPEFPKRCPPNKFFLETKYLTIAEHLKKNGYKTAHIGKWHLGDIGHSPTDQGYDINIGGCDLGHPPSYFEPYRSRAQNGPRIPEEALPLRKPGEYLTDREADEAVRFIREHKDKSFFLHLAHYAVHTPLQARPETVARYRAKLERMQKRGEKPKQKNPTYAAMLQSVDEAMGQLLDTLLSEGIADRTYVIFTSDNGGLVGPTDNTPLRSGKGFAYEGGIREPFLVWAPGRVAAGTTNDIPTITMDLFPTVCDLAGISLPKSLLDGLSIRPLLEQENGENVKKLEKRPLFWHFPHYRGSEPANSPYSIVRHGDWKLIRFDDGNILELYHLRNDISESNNLAEKEREIARKLVKLLDEHLDSVGAGRVKLNPDYRPTVKLHFPLNFCKFYNPIYSNTVHRCF